MCSEQNRCPALNSFTLENCVSGGKACQLRAWNGGNPVKTAKDFDEYIAGFPVEVQKLLETLRTTIHKAAPRAGEAIKYQIPTFTLNGNLISFAAYKNHIGVYPAPRDVPEFKSELAAYKGNKSTLQLPLDKPIPVDLISRIVKYQLMRTQKQAVAKGK
jgi:uncharacterized protein YdhG (YjbR/CyaY superfamily)